MYYTWAQREKHLRNLRCQSKESLAPAFRNYSACNSQLEGFVLVLLLCLYGNLQLTLSVMQRWF